MGSIGAWLLVYRVVSGFMWGTSDRDEGAVALPTREACEAARVALAQLPPIAHGMLVSEPCRDGAAEGRTPGHHLGGKSRRADGKGRPGGGRPATR
jgi:hypothetical protein